MRQCVHAVSADWHERYTDAERALIVAFMETDITRKLTPAEKTLATNAQKLKKGINDHFTGTERTRLIQVLSDRANAKAKYGLLRNVRYTARKLVVTDIVLGTILAVLKYAKIK